MHTFAQKPKATQQTTSARSAIPGRGHLGQSPEVKSILHLQRTIGNQAVQRMLQTDAGQPEAELTGPASPRFGQDLSRIPIHPPAAGAIQTKLAINELGDGYEEDADRMAEQVMRTPEPQLQRACPCGGGCPKCHTEQPGREHESLQTKRVQASDTAQIAAPPSVHEVLRSPGQLLDAATRAFMEPRFGHDFSRVRVHSGTAAEQSAQDVNAYAYTMGHHVVFGAHRLAPGTHEGQRLLAHELTHVVQQSGADEIRVGHSDDRHGLSSIPSNFTIPLPFQTQRTTTPQLQRKRSRQQVGKREATVEIRWSEDSIDFYHRLVEALVRNPGFRGIDASAFRASSTKEPWGLLQTAKDFHIHYAMHHSGRKVGKTIKVYVSAFYNPGHDIYDSDLTDITIVSGEKPALDKAVQEAPAPNTTQPPPFVRPESVVEMREVLDDAENLLVDPVFLNLRERSRLYQIGAMPRDWKPDAAGALLRIDAALDFVRPLVEPDNIKRHGAEFLTPSNVGPSNLTVKNLKATALGVYDTTAWLEGAKKSFEEVSRARDQAGTSPYDLAIKAKSLLAFRSAAPLKVLANEGLSFELELGSSPRPAPEFRSHLRAQFPNDPNLSQRELRVLAWLRDNKDIILEAERAFRVDRRAIAGVIAWEAMENIMRGSPRSAGPGKMHTYSNALAAVVPLEKRDALPQQVEAAGLVPKPKSDDERDAILRMPKGSVTYIAAAMRGAADIAARYGYDISHDLIALTSFYQAYDLPKWEEHLREKQKSGETTFVAADPIPLWMQSHIDYLESVLGHP
jgi:hypothetical protein